MVIDTCFPFLALIARGSVVRRWTFSSEDRFDLSAASFP